MAQVAQGVTEKALPVPGTDNAGLTLHCGLLRRVPAYTPYGYIHEEPDWQPRLGFNGEVHAHPNRYSLGIGYRMYDTVLMRFLSPDTDSPFSAGGSNGYAYCSSDPVNYADPSGHARKIMYSQLDSALETIKRSPQRLMQLHEAREGVKAKFSGGLSHDRPLREQSRVLSKQIGSERARYDLARGMINDYIAQQEPASGSTPFLRYLKDKLAIPAKQPLRNLMAPDNAFNPYGARRDSATFIQQRWSSGDFDLSHESLEKRLIGSNKR